MDRRVPNVIHFQEFGFNVFCLDKVPDKGKFETRSRKGIFLGYSTNSKGFRVWLPKERKIEITRDVKFLTNRVDSLNMVFEEFTP